MSASAFVRCAQQQVGKRYALGTHGPNSFDCSGLVCYCYERATGKTITCGSVQQFSLGTKVTGPYQPGDLLFWDTSGPAPGHVAIYEGENTVIHAMNPSRGVLRSKADANMGGRFMGARRLQFSEGGGGGLPPPPSPPDKDDDDRDKKRRRRKRRERKERDDRPPKRQGADPPAEEVLEPDPKPPLPDASTGYIAYDLPGSERPLYLPHWLTYREHLTPPGPNRSQKPMRPTVTVVHSTGNTNPGRDAGDHAEWQRQGTPGHPDGKIGVHGYVDANEFVLTIPIDEQGVHSGDWRNQWGIAIERTMNSDQAQWEAENNAMHVHAGMLFAIGKGVDAMTQHGSSVGCPVLVQPWAEWQRVVGLRLARIRAAAGE